MSEVVIQQFSFSCSTRLQPERHPSQGSDPQEVQDSRSLPDQPQRSQPRAGSAASAQDGRPETPPPPSVEGGAAPRSRDQPAPLTQGMLGRLSESDGQRPATKRQLSSESAARTVGVLKKSAVRKGGEGEAKPGTPPRSKPPLGATGAPGRAGGLGSRRRRRQELLCGSGGFLRVDTQALRAGAELKEQRVFAVSSIAQRLLQDVEGELARLRTIWTWLCHSIEYDVSGYLGQTEQLCSPEEVVEAGRGVCCGYASLCLELCREAGIECQEVPGFSKGIGHRQGCSLRGLRSDHMWNAVRLGGQWCLLDACWGAGRVDMDTQSFVRRFDDFYFLTDPEDFIDSHFPDDERWQLLDAPLSLEEFERRVFKTSAFYTLGLSLIQPKHFLLVTEEGEATVTLGFSRPVTFTYEVSQTGASPPEEASCSCGLLTMSPRSMKLRLLPPAAGTYNVKIFARPEAATTPFSWVCSFTLECSTPKATQEIPENPFLSWGLQPGAGSLGVEGCSQGSEVAELEAGQFELVLRTSRPLMLLCELVHPGLPPGLAKRCLASQMEPHRLTCHVLCPHPGFYRLSVFVRDYERSEARFQNAGNFLLHCSRGGVDLDQLFPPDLSSCCGPGIRTLDAGLSRFSHTGALVSTQQGKCNITFHTPPELELHAVLARGDAAPRDLPLSRHVFFTQTDSKVTVSASLPRPGVYRLGLYARAGPGRDFNPLGDFVVRNSCERPGLPFPSAFSAWRRGCVLLEPRSGRLEARAWVRFRVRVPGALRVAVLGDGRTELRQNRTGVWEGEAFTGDGLAQLRLAASTSEASDMAVLLTFDLQQQQKEEVTHLEEEGPDVQTP